MSNTIGVDADAYSARGNWAPRRVVTAAWLVVVVPAYILAWFCLVLIDFSIYQLRPNPDHAPGCGTPTPGNAMIKGRVR